MNDNPSATVREVPVTQADRDAMLHKHPVETGLVEIMRTPGVIVGRKVYEVFHHEIDGVVKIYDIREIKNAIHADQVPVICMRVTLNDAYVNHLYTYGGCEQDHVNRITAEDIKRPGIGFVYPEGLQIVDGSHRIVARWRRFGKKHARLLVLPGAIDHMFLIDPSEFNPISVRV